MVLTTTALAGVLNIAENDITVSASGGTAPLSYQLNDGTPQSDPNFLDLPNGEYTITIIDANGCEMELSATIAINTLEVSAALVNGISCFDANDAVISVTVSGGTPPPPVQHRWAELPSGEYLPRPWSWHLYNHGIR